MRGILVAAVLLVGTFCSASPTEVFAVPLTSRIDPDSIPEFARTDAPVRGARGEVESFYVVVRPEPKTTIEARISKLASDTDELPAANARIHQVLFTESAKGKVADVVAPMPEGGIKVTRAENLPLLVEVSIPRDAVPGIYRGVVEILVNGAVDGVVPVKLHVLRATLPATASLPTAFDFDGRGAWMVHGGDLEARREVAGKYAQSALEHRVSLVGGSGLSPSKGAIAPGDGFMELDFKDFDREMTKLLEGVPELSGAKATAISVKTPKNLTQMERFKYVLAVRKHLREKGWMKALVLVDGAPVFARDEGREAQVIVECEGVSSCRSLSAKQRPWWRLTSAGNGEHSVGVGADPAKIRAIGWAAYQMNAAGLRFDGASEGFTDAALGGAVGPGALFYPPRAAGSAAWPLPSVRLKLLRDALEDYELLVQAEQIRKQRMQRMIGELRPSVPATAKDALKEILDEEDETHTEASLTPRSNHTAAP